MKKTLTIALAGISLCILPFSAAYAIGLKDNSLLNDDTIKLGDIFYDLKENEDRVLGNAPRPGQDMVLDANTLLRIAIAMDLSWRPNSNADHITLRRDATIIDYNQIEEALHTALYDEGVFGEYELSVPQSNRQIILPPNQEATFIITDFSVDQRRNTFEATIAAPSAENPIQHIRFSGQMEPVITVPVLLENVENGRTIKARDLTTMKIKERGFGRDTIIDVQSLIGMTARRMLIAGRPIREAEIIAPQIIDRGQVVTLSLKNAVMNITTQVKSLENGAKGDVIRVLNTSSNQTIQAIVTGENEVTVLQN